MLTQIYEVSTPEAAEAISAIGVDHVGILVGTGEFPREQPLAEAKRIAAGLRRPSKLSALFLSSDPAWIIETAKALGPDIIHLGAAPELLPPAAVAQIRAQLPGLPIMRSIPVVDAQSIAVAAAYVGIADFLLLDSYRVDDRQIGALGVTHDWSISRRIVLEVPIPVILAGGLGPDNVEAAIAAVGPAGVDSKTRTDVQGSHAKDLDKVRRFHEAATRASRQMPARPPSRPSGGLPPEGEDPETART
jgi:phosphoribosylanthranilate isomerase